MSFQIVTVLFNFHSWTCLNCLLTLFWTHSKVLVLSYAAKDWFGWSKASRALLFICYILAKVIGLVLWWQMFNLQRSVCQHTYQYRMYKHVLQSSPSIQWSEASEKEKNENQREIDQRLSRTISVTQIVVNRENLRKLKKIRKDSSRVLVAFVKACCGL